MKVLVLLVVVGAALAAKLPLEEEEEFIEPPKPYNFGFEVRDDNTTNYQNRAEASDGEGRVRGSYSYVLPDGFVYTVVYEDNKDGEGLKVRETRTARALRNLYTNHQLGRLVSESACERKDPGSNPAADMVDAARNTAWDLGKTTE
ncbi:Insect cuticle protein [Trinorchestia longiramus]|nr:Insect cuticle protein [Trinorchestia longiramus]